MTSVAPLLAFVLLWSSGYVVGAFGVEAAQPLGLLSLRFALALLVAIPVGMRVPGWRSQPLGRLALIGLLIQGVQFAGVYGGLALGVPAGLSALIVLGLAPVATTAIATAAGMESPSGKVWLALGAGVAGVALSLVPELDDAQVGAGVGLVLLGMLGLAGGTVLQKRWVHDADRQVTVATQIAAAAVALVPIAALTGQLDLHPSVQLGWSVAWLAWPLSIGATSLYVTILTRHEASTTAALLLVVPAITALASAVLLGERVHALTVAGMVVTFAAVSSVVRMQSARTREADANPMRPAWRRFAPLHAAKALVGRS